MWLSFTPAGFVAEFLTMQVKLAESLVNHGSGAFEVSGHMVFFSFLDRIPLTLEWVGWLVIFMLIAGRKSVRHGLSAARRAAAMGSQEMPRWLQLFCVQDLRSLAVARIGLGLVILVDIAFRCLDLQAHYGDLGVLPRGALLQNFHNQWHWSFHFFSGLSSAQGLLFLCQAIIAMALLVGYRTRLVLLLSWAFLVSLHHRNWLVLQSGDSLLRCLVFFAMFLPMGARWSVDSAFGRAASTASNRWCSWAGAGWTIQVMLIYLCALIHKWHPAWHDGLAVEMVVHVSSFATPLAVWAQAYPAMLRCLTLATLTLEIAGPLLLLVAFRNGLNRTLAVFLMCGLHLGFSLFLKVGLFTPIMMVAWIFFLPGSFWDCLDKLLRSRSPRGLEIFYAGDSVLCRWAATVIRGLAGLPRECLRDMRSDQEIYDLCRRERSWVVRAGGGASCHHGFEAFLVIMEHSPLLGLLQPLAAWRPLARCGELLHRRLATVSCGDMSLPGCLRPATAVPVKNRWYAMGQATALLALVYVILWNLRFVDTHDDVEKHFKKSLAVSGQLPLGWFDAYKPVGQVLGLEQSWNVFSPHPPTSDGWFVIRAVTVGGEELDLYNRGRFVDGLAGELDWLKPENVAAGYVRQRWRKYLRKLPREDYKGHRVWFGRWLTRISNEQRSGDDRIESFEIWYVEQTRDMNGVTSGPTRISLHQHDCLPR